jgi:copper chaperone
MKKIEVKTNINCSACVAKVTPTLNKKIGENNWHVNTVSPRKILTVTTDEISEGDVIKAVEEAGYKAEMLD